MEKVETHIDHQKNFCIGILLSISSSIFIGSSFIIKKLALKKLNLVGGLRAGNGGYGYLKEWIWWAGLLCMGVGEAANFIAYAFAPASLVTPLGALSVLVAAVLSSKILNERLNLLGKLGCFLCIVGSTIIVIHSPKETEIENINILTDKMTETSFVLYVLFAITVSVVIGMYIGPKYGHLNILVYIFLCSLIGSLTVMSVKVLGLCMRDTISGKSNDFGTPMPYFFIILTIILIVVQMNYLNKALDIFDTSIVTPIYYVMFTSFVIGASGILLQEWKNMEVADIVGDLCGFLVVVVAVVLLNAFKEVDISAIDVRNIMKPKRPVVQDNVIDNVLVRRSSTELKMGYGTTGSYRNL